MTEDRRRFLAAAGIGIAAFSTSFAVAADREDREEAEEHGEAGVTATEDLMREHGVLNRILLIYEEGLRRLRSRAEVSPEIFHASASLVQNFVEDYHEKLEEKFIFPQFDKHNAMVELVATLRKQHEAGRKLTEVILRDSESGRFNAEASRRELGRACRDFIRMYRPHEAREDTVLFPALHSLLTPDQIHELGEQFEEQEDARFGEGGFTKTVGQVAAIEKQLGIYDLAQFTPTWP